MADQFDDPSDFQNAFLQDLDEHMRCGICKEFYTTAMILTTCSHSFCALCIRRSLSTEPCCPKCRVPTHDSKLHNNYELDNIVNSWRTARPAVLQLDQKKEQQPSSEAASKMVQTTGPVVRNPVVPENTATQQPFDPSLQAPVYVGQPIPGYATAQYPAYAGSQAPVYATSHTPIYTGPHTPMHIGPQTPVYAGSSLSAPATPTQVNQEVGRRRSGRLEQRKMAANTADAVIATNVPNVPIIPQPPLPPPPQPMVNDTLTSDREVECAVCGKSMKFAILNAHLDRCLKGDSSVTGLARNEPSFAHIPPKKPTKLVYGILKDKDLREILRGLGLPDTGDKKQMIWRHKEYLTLYAANADSQNPVSASVLLRQLQELESAYVHSRNAPLKRSTPDLDQHQAKYKDNFAQLIEQARSQKRSRVVSTEENEEPAEKNLKNKHATVLLLHHPIHHVNAYSTSTDIRSSAGPSQQQWNKPVYQYRRDGINENLREHKHHPSIGCYSGHSDGTITWVGLINTQPTQGFTNNAITMIVVPAALGTLGAILLVVCWNIGIYIVGAVGGLALALFVCCWHANHVIVNDVGRACFLAGLPLVFALITFFAERHIILLSTSFTGAFVLLLGIDLLAHTQYLAGITSVLDRRHAIPYSVTRKAYVMMAVTIFVFLVSFGWQHFYNAHRQFGVHVVQPKAEHESTTEANDAAKEDEEDGHSTAAATPSDSLPDEAKSSTESPPENNHGK
ncbi:E3 ubiquitin-protein ligase rad18 [Apophysomyces ossiformis]|uniref:Postreplication repair E3 ubiquitin-protein ligase RAD18 n=1 Tax=Apophysomyces ossiformis TaxID=679940 RepID=A0A8H7C090_9FUNG|nr:E3 ubiquitin-protein ligase rad18 [Apophysomyces ossiformis]